MRRRLASKTLWVVFVTLLGVLLVTFVNPPPAKAELSAAGPIDPANGYPYWYEDANGTRLELCLDPNDARCLQPFESPDPAGPVVFPDNFPGEAFWWAGEAQTTLNNGSDALLVLAMESTFANEEAVEGDQMSFGRIRIRVDGLTVGDTYRVRHPFGTDVFVAEDDGRGVGEINATEDIGCFPTPQTPCDFSEVRFSRVGPFLTAENAPAGYLGDPNLPDEVTGSVVLDDENQPQNYFEIEHLVGGTYQTIGSTDEFAVSGKLATLKVGASPRRSVFNAPQEITLTASEPGASIFYTTDPNVADADIATQGTQYAGPFTLTGTANAVENVNLRFVAVNGENQTDVVSRDFTVDRVAPNVVASPEPGIFEGPIVDDPATTDVVEGVALSAENVLEDGVTREPDADSTIYYTTDDEVADGDIASEGEQYTQPLQVKRSQRIRAVAVDNADDTVRSRVETFGYTIANLKKEHGPINPQGKHPFWYEDLNGTRLEMCLDPQDPLCLVPFEMPNPDAAQVDYPANFPGESFWWAGEADIDRPNAKRTQLVMALEATYANEEPNDQDAMSFGRIRIRVSDLVIGETYTVTHPYGVDTFVAEDDGKGVGEINVTEDIGCFPTPQTPCDFSEVRFSRIGPFLTANNAPAGYLGDPNAPSPVTGSPFDTNYFEVSGPNVGGPGVNSVRTDLFSISGKLATLHATPSVRGGVFGAPQNVGLAASFADANVHFTLDGNAPTASSPVLGPQESINIDEDTTLKFIAVNPTTGEQSEVFTEEYIIDTEAPVVSADPAGGTFENEGPTVALSAQDETETRIFYTTDGQDPAPGSPNTTLYSAPISINGDTTLKFVGVDAAGNRSQIVSETYDVIDTNPPAAPAQFNLTAGDTGLSTMDGITSSNTLTFGGTAEPGSTVSLFAIGQATGQNAAARVLSSESTSTESTTAAQEEGNLVGSATAGQNGAFSITVEIEDGEYTFYAVAKDPSGNSSQRSLSKEIKVDTISPIVSANPGGGVYVGTRPVTLTPSEVGKVYYTLNGANPVPTGANTREATGPIQISANTTLKFMAVDVAGNRSSITTENYVIQNARPTVTAIRPVGVIRDRTPLIAATVRDRETDLARSNITLRIDGRNRPGFAYNRTTDRLSITPSLRAGGHTVTIIARDGSGSPTTKTWRFTIR